MTTPKDCARFVALQDRRLAEEEPLCAEDEAFLAEHGSHCPTCGLEAATLSTLQLEKGMAPDPALSDSMILRRVERVMDARSTPQMASPPGKLRRVGLAASAAAAAALAVLYFGQPWKTAVAPSAPPKATLSRPGHLTLISGKVDIGPRPATVNQRLAAGEILRVASGRAVLTFEDGSNVSLTARSQLEILAVNGRHIRVRLHAGEATFRVAPQRSGRHFDVMAAWGKVSVVGTVFQVSHARPERVLVARGEVKVRMGNAPVASLKGGMMVRADRKVGRVSRRTQKTLLSAADAASRLVVKDPALLSIQTRRPGATVVVDDTLVGVTPMELCLPPGAHRLTVSRQGHTAVKRTVELAVGKRLRLNLKLVALASSLGTGDPVRPTPPTTSVATAGAGRHGSRSSGPTSSAGRPVSRPKAVVPVPELEAPTVGQLVRHAAIYRASGKWRAVVKVYRQLIRLHPGSPEAASSLVLAGQVLLRHLAQPAAALRYFNAYLARYRSGAIAQEAAWARINCLRRLGRRSAEIKACRELLKRHPTSVYAKRVRARLGALTGGAK